jgi:PASTA domain
MRIVVAAAVAVLVVIGAWRSWVAPLDDAGDDGVRPEAPLPPSTSGPVLGAEDPAFVLMPDVVGLDDGFATHVLQVTPLRLGDVRLKPSAKPWGSVLSQSIPAGASVPRRTRVDIVLAKGVLPEAPAGSVETSGARARRRHGRA